MSKREEVIEVIKRANYEFAKTNINKMFEEPLRVKAIADALLERPELFDGCSHCECPCVHCPNCGRAREEGK